MSEFEMILFITNLKKNWLLHRPFPCTYIITLFKTQEGPQRQHSTLCKKIKIVLTLLALIRYYMITSGCQQSQPLQTTVGFLGTRPKRVISRLFTVKKEKLFPSIMIKTLDSNYSEA